MFIIPENSQLKYCSYYVFEGCVSLNKLPALPTKRLYGRCYERMFNGCTSLNSVTMLATDISATFCLENWLSGVAATGTFIKAASMTSLINNSVRGIPPGWTVQDYVEQGN